MDRMQEAVERARTEREGSIGQTCEPGENRPPVIEQAATLGSVLGVAPRRSGNRAQRVPDFEYRRTRTVKLNREHLRRNRVIAAATNDPRVEIYRQLRSQVLSTLRRNNMRTLAITSAHEDAGKTLTAVNLAISISQEVNQTVLLVDLDLRQPSVHTTLGLGVKKGIVDHLSDGEALENILVNPQLPRLVVLPGLPQKH